MEENALHSQVDLQSQSKCPRRRARLSGARPGDLSTLLNADGQLFIPKSTCRHRHPMVLCWLDSLNTSPASLTTTTRIQISLFHTVCMNDHRQVVTGLKGAKSSNNPSKFRSRHLGVCLRLESVVAS